MDDCIGIDRPGPEGFDVGSLGPLPARDPGGPLTGPFHHEYRLLAPDARVLKMFLEGPQQLRVSWHESLSIALAMSNVDLWPVA